MERKKTEESNVVVVDTNAIKKEVIDYVDIELDKRVNKYVTDKIKKEFIDEVNKANNRVIREKNKKLFIKNIFLLLFLCIIVFLVYLLYTDHYFDRFFINNNTTKQEEVIKENSGVIEELAPSLEELKNEYASLLDPYILNDESIYLEDYYKGKLTDEIKNYITLNSIDFSKLETEDDYQTIESKLLNDVCNSLFDKKCNNTNFDYNGNKIRYLDKLDSYISNSLLDRKDTNIVREITNIEVENNTVIIETIEGVVIDNQVFRIYPNEYLGEYNEDINAYNEQLNKVRYTFKNKKLVNIENL